MTLPTPRRTAARIAGTFALVLGLCFGPSAHASVSLIGELAYDYVVEPGQAYSGTLEIQNLDAAPQEVKVYQNDYFFYADGQILYAEPGDLPRSNARWLTVAPLRLTVPAGEKAVIRYSIQVPDDPTLQGSYWSMLMIEPVSPEDTESSAPDPDKPAVSVRQVMRYGIQIVTQVGSTGTTQLKFSRLQLTAEDGKRSLHLDVENPGERWYRATVWVELYNESGGYVGKYEAGTLRLYPGTSARFTADLAGVQKGTYKALIVADCGGDDVFGANVNLVLKQ